MIKFQEFRQNVNTRVTYLRKESTKADRKAVRTGKLNDRIDAIQFRAQLEELGKLIKDLNNTTL